MDYLLLNHHDILWGGVRRLRHPDLNCVQFSLGRMTNIVNIQNKSRLDQVFSPVRYGEKHFNLGSSVRIL